ncbi:MAG: glycosyltransferase [Mycobacterium sp.]
MKGQDNMSDPTRVLMILDSFNFGGAENLIAELGRYHPAALDVSVASLASASQDRNAMLDRLTEAGLQPEYLSVDKLLDPAGFFGLVRTLRRARVDVVHAHLGYAATLVPVAARLAGKPVVATLHLSPQRHSSRREWFKERLSVRIPARLGRLVLVSQHAFDQYALVHGPARASWRMIPNGVDVERYTVRAGARASEPPVWAVVAALRPDKNHVDLIRAWIDVVAVHPGAILLVIGDGPSRSDIEQAVTAAGLGESVEFLGRREDVAEILRRVDGVVSASVDEALPTALIEAGASGLPVVATDAGGTREIVVDGITGRLVPIRDVPALTDALLDTIGDRARAAAYGAAGRAQAQKKYSMAKWVDRLGLLYQEAISGPPSASLTVAHVIHSLGPGGAEGLLVELARAATAAGIRLIVIGLSDEQCAAGVDNRAVPPLRALGATVYEMHTGRYDVTAVWRLAGLLRDEHVHIVHTHLKHADVVGGIAARLVGVPSVSTLHVIDIPTSRMHRARVKIGLFARRHLSSTVIALSTAQRRWYAQYSGDDSSIIVLPNGIGDPEVVDDSSAIRAELRVPDGALLASCVSLMRPEKGHADLLEAVRLLPADLPLVLALAGDGPLLESFRSTVDSDSALRERVRVLGFRSDAADLIAASDFVVHPSLEDALPTALLSALAGARPIVATDVGGIPDIVAPDCGLLVEAGRPAELSAGIAKMASIAIDDPAAFAEMRRAARVRYESHFSSDIWVKNLGAVYERAIAARKERGRPHHRDPRGNLTEKGVVVRPRRIALVEFAPSGGLFQFSLQLGEALARSGVDVELITGPSPELTSREPGCRVRAVLPTWHPAAGADAPQWWRRARRGVRAGQYSLAWAVLLAHLLRTRPDAVIWSAWRFPIDGWGVHLVRKALPNAVLAAVAHEPRPVVEQPGQDSLYKTSSTTDRALSTAYADLDVAFVLGEKAKQILTATWPITAPVHVIPHGDEGIFANAPIPGAEATGPVALSFGLITAYKGIDTLCEAWPMVRAAVPDAELVIAGALSQDIDELVLRQQVSNLAGVSLQIGYIPVAEVSSYFARARCVVLPYKRSSQSGVAHLAHTLRRPVVATRVGDIPAVVRDGESGLLVAPEDPEALAAAVVRLLEDPQLARTLGETGAQDLRSAASWDDVAARLYQGLPILRSQ